MRLFFKLIRNLSIAFIAVLLVSVGIDAADKHDNISESIIGRIVFGEAEGPCPDDMVFVPNTEGGFCIDRYEASTSENCPIQDTKSQIDTRDNLDIAECIPVSQKARMPWRFISQSQAMIACAKAGKRLASSKEWYEASLGTPDEDGNWQAESCQVDNNWSQQPGVTGSGEKCVSSFGAYDMIGNVWEWVSGEVNSGNYQGMELPQSGFITEVNSSGMVISTSEDADPNFNEDYLWIKESGNRGIARGGYWSNKSEAGLYSLYMVSPSSFAGDGVGFRCAK